MPPQTAEDEFIFLDAETQAQVVAPLNAQDTAEAQEPLKEDQSFFNIWVDKSSAKHSTPEIFGADKLRNLYPNYSLVMSEDPRLNPLALPGVQVEAFSASEVITNAVFASLPRRTGAKVPGALIDSVVFGAFNVTWGNHSFIVYVTKFPQGFGIKTQHFILHDGPEQAARDLLLAAGLFQDALHDEIWVFNQGFWSKNKALFAEVQKSSWDDVVLKDEFKKGLQKDIYGFFKSEAVYKELSIPWKRGLIMYGPPGNGKTISIKVIMKTCAEQGFNPLYVKSFQSYRGEEGAMQDVFEKARQIAPCVVILEDLDSLINDRNRSFFLNQLDGLEGNDGLLVIGSTNHFDKLDPALSERPSRFDRKYNFDDPDYDARELYAKYWQGKLKSNTAIFFPDSLPAEVAASTPGFSFAYLKEAFVSTLVIFASEEDGQKSDFGTLLKGQIATLRKELGKQKQDNGKGFMEAVAHHRALAKQARSREAEPGNVLSQPHVSNHGVTPATTTTPTTGEGSLTLITPTTVSPLLGPPSLESIRLNQLRLNQYLNNSQRAPATAPMNPMRAPATAPMNLMYPPCSAPSPVTLLPKPGCSPRPSVPDTFQPSYPKFAMPGSLPPQSDGDTAVKCVVGARAPRSYTMDDTNAVRTTSPKDAFEKDPFEQQPDEPKDDLLSPLDTSPKDEPNDYTPSIGIPIKPDVMRRSPVGGRPSSLLARGRLSAAPSYAYPPAPIMPGSLQDGDDATGSSRKKSTSTEGVVSELFRF